MTVVKFFVGQNNDIIPKEKPWPIHVPAAAVIHEWLALFILIGC